MILEKLPHAEKYGDNRMAKATLLFDEYHAAYLFFMLYEGKWYYIFRDNCDCSAQIYSQHTKHTGIKKPDR